MIPSSGQEETLLWELPDTGLLETMIGLQVTGVTMQLAPTGPTAKPIFAQHLTVDPHVKLMHLEYMRHELAEAKT